MEKKKKKKTMLSFYFIFKNKDNYNNSRDIWATSLQNNVSWEHPFK